MAKRLPSIEPDPVPYSERPIRSLTAEELFAAVESHDRSVCWCGEEPYDLEVMDAKPPKFIESRTVRRRG